MRKFILRSDGGSTSPTNCYFSYVLEEIQEDGSTKHTMSSSSKSVSAHTSNEAEYLGLSIGILLSRPRLKNSSLIIECDSKLVVMQILELWKVNKPSLIPYVSNARAWLSLLSDTNTTYTLSHIPRENNKVADKLCQYAAKGLYKRDLIESPEEFFKKNKEKFKNGE